MPKSRYADSPVLTGSGGSMYGSRGLPVQALGYRELDLLEGVETVEHVVRQGERLDHIAFRFLGDESYWWVVALVNGIDYPFSSGGLTAGSTLRIPREIRDVLDRIMR